MNAMNETSIDLSDDISAVDPFYRALAVVLTYPQAEWLAALDELDAVVKQDQPTTLATDWHTLIDYFRTTDLIELQERYVQTFDRTPSHSLHLFEHVHGEDRARGQAMTANADRGCRARDAPVALPALTGGSARRNPGSPGPWGGA